MTGVQTCALPILLPQHWVDDRLFWPFTQIGTYTSKLGYRFLKSKEETAENPARLTEERELWRGIWSLQVPNKIKNFIWRACCNSLPMKENLVHQTIIENPLCDRCFCANESAFHALWSCGELDVVWEDLSLWSCRNTLNFITFKEDRKSVV